MTIDEAIEVLELHNQWRKGAEIPQESPIRIGMAIDLVVCELKNLRKPLVIGRSEQLFCLCKEDAVIDSKGQCRMCGFDEKIEAK